jgi:hypothetical protein
MPECAGMRRIATKFTGMPSRLVRNGSRWCTRARCPRIRQSYCELLIRCGAGTDCGRGRTGRVGRHRMSRRVAIGYDPALASDRVQVATGKRSGVRTSRSNCRDSPPSGGTVSAFRCSGILCRQARELADWLSSPGCQVRSQRKPAGADCNPSRAFTTLLCRRPA